jgi:predicted nucleic-acid-binding protein
MYGAIVDTNILIRVITKDDSLRAQQATDLLGKYQTGQIALETAVFYETTFILTSKKHYAMPKNVAADALRALLATGLFACDEELLLVVLELYVSTNLDFVDCLVAAHVRLRRAKTLLTLDKRLLAKLNTP